MAGTKKEEAKKTEKKSEDIQSIFATAILSLNEALKTIPKEKLAQAQKEVNSMFSGDMSWADLTQYTPEKISKIAEMAYEQFNIGRYDQAEKLLKGLTVIAPDNFYGHQMLGAVFQRKEMYPEALVEYSIAIDLFPEDMVSLTNRGEVYFKLGLYPVALADLDKVISLDKKGDDRWAARARMVKEQIKIIKERAK